MCSRENLDAKALIDGITAAWFPFLFLKTKLKILSALLATVEASFTVRAILPVDCFHNPFEPKLGAAAPVTVSSVESTV
jgi:hypothetical protein